MSHGIKTRKNQVRKQAIPLSVWFVGRHLRLWGADKIPHHTILIYMAQISRDIEARSIIG